MWLVHNGTGQASRFATEEEAIAFQKRYPSFKLERLVMPEPPTVQEADNGLQTEAQKEDEVATPEPESEPEPAKKGRRKALSFAN